MKNSRNARRYAEALYDVAKEHGHEEQIERELLTVRQVFSAPSELVDFLQDPKQWMNRARIIKSTFTTFSSELVKLILIMIENHAEQDVPGMVDHYTYLINEKRGIGVGKVYSVTHLTPHQLEDIEVHFAEGFGYKRLALQNEIDESVIGGFKVVINNRVYDASLKAKLEEVKRKFVPLYKR